LRYLALLMVAFAASLCTQSAHADDTQPVTLTVTQNEARIADAINVLQQETGYTIVVDSTVIGRMGTAKVSFATLPMMLDFLKTMEPGLTYTQIYIAQNKPTPSGQDCFDLVRTMEWLSDQGNPVLVTAAGTISILNQTTTPELAPPGMRKIWYISDEQIRAQQYQEAQQAARLAAQQAVQQAARMQVQTTAPQYTYQQPILTNATRQRTFQVAPGLTILR